MFKLILRWLALVEMLSFIIARTDKLSVFILICLSIKVSCSKVPKKLDLYPNVTFCSAVLIGTSGRQTFSHASVSSIVKLPVTCIIETGSESS